jgi:hypothetical protein
MVWTGAEVVVWGGAGSFGFPTDLNTGGRYNPVTDTWQSTSLTGAPSPRMEPVEVWTGSEMIIWSGRGGADANSGMDTGARYNPITDAWTPMTMENAPSGRSGCLVVWTGSELIAWGGHKGTPLNTGGRYSPAADTWVPTTLSGAPPPRFSHEAVWTGSEMVIFGGWDFSQYFSSTYAYRPPRTVFLHLKP